MVAMLSNGACRSYDGSGRSDLLLRRNATGELFVRPHSGTFDGPSTWDEPVLVAKDMGWQRFGFVRPIDNGTGRADLLAFSLEGVNPGVDGQHGLYVLANIGGLDGTSTFDTEPLRISGRREDGRVWETVGLADISGNGADDTFSRGMSAGNVDWFRHSGTVVPDDTWDKTPRRLTSVEVDDFPLAMADFSRTGRLDLLVRRANGDLDLFVFAADHDLAGSAEAGAGSWHTLAHGWQQYSYAVLADVDLDGVPDLLATRWDGTLVACRHRGTFDPGDPLATFEPPVTVGTGFEQYDVVS